MKPNERLAAVRILHRVVVDKVSLTNAFEGSSSSLTKAICFGVCRYYFLLERVADSLITKRPKAVEVWLILLIGLYQLNFLSKPAYATVQETVDLLEPLNKMWAKGLVNAVLRRFCREGLKIADNDPQLTHPQWFIEKLQQDWPSYWASVLRANDEQPPLTLRVSGQKIGREAYLQQLETQGIKASPLKHSSQGFVLEEACEVDKIPGFFQGFVSVQEEAAQYAAPLLALKPGLRVLDACCAPGGKLCHLLEIESQLSHCLGLDVDKKRLVRVQENLQRLNLETELRAGDARFPEQWWDGNLYDRILLDAPCSATGVIRRHPDIKLLRHEDEIKTVLVIQSTLLKALWPLLKPGGMLLYATCSVLQEENAQQIKLFLLEHEDAKINCEEVPWGINTGFGWQVLPGDSNCDGFFYGLLEKML